MFERQRSAINAPDSRTVVTVTMSDGEVLRGSLRLPLSGRLGDGLNNADPFIDFETAKGDRIYLAKHSIRRMESFDVPRADQLRRGEREIAAFDPFAILGVAKGAGPQAIRQAYLSLARAYHPDRFHGLDLPREIMDYANAMLTRINVAYQQLEGRAAQ